MSTHMCTHMGSVNISVREEAYEFLKSLKSGEKSFSDVILEFKEKKGDIKSIMRYFGALKDEDIDWAGKEKRMRELRDSFNRRLDKKNDRIR